MIHDDRPTLDNWLEPPHLHWSLRHARELIPTALVRRGESIRALSDDPDDGLLDLEFVGHQGRRSIGTWLQTTEVDSLTVLRGESVVLEWRAPDVRADDVHLLFSVTKSITSLLCGALVGRGLIDVDAPVSEYVPEVGASGFAGASVRHLLDMTASYAFVEDYDPGDDVTAYRKAAGWYPDVPGAPTLRDFIATREPDGAHGQRFRYQSPTTDLLGWVCERVTQKPYATALSEHLWAPMGAEFDACVTVDRHGASRAAGGLSATARDLARVGLLMAEGGRGIVPEAYLDDLTRAGNPAQWADGDFAPWLPGGAYRSCWYQPRVDPDAIMGVGIHGQMLYVDRARGVSVAKQSSWSIPSSTDDHDDDYLACQTLARTIGG